MKTDKLSNSAVEIPKNKKGINVEALKGIADKFAVINEYIETGKDVPTELTKNFVTCTLSDDPYSKLE